MLEKTADYITEEDYLTQEETSEIKHEYFEGEIFAMTGASRKHNRIVTNVIRELSTQVKKAPCRVYPSDMRLKIEATGLYTYPNVMVVCGEEKFGDDKPDSLLNPHVIIEVLSDSTEAYDRGRKFENYRTLESLKEYVLISQYKPKIEKYSRIENRKWMLSETDETHTVINLESVDCKLAIEEIYYKVDD